MIYHQIINNSPPIKMQPQPPSNSSQPHPAKQSSAAKTSNNKSLLPMQSPIFEIVKKSPGQSEHEYIIRKLMDRKEKKPDIGFVQRSPLFKELEAMMPVIRKSNEQLIRKGVKEEQKIDVQLQQVQDSSSSQSQSSSVNENEEEIEKVQGNNQARNTQKQRKNKKKVSKIQNEMLDEHEQRESTGNEIQLNFLRYPLPLEPVPVPASETSTDSNSKKLIEEL